MPKAFEAKIEKDCPAVKGHGGKRRRGKRRRVRSEATFKKDFLAGKSRRGKRRDYARKRAAEVGPYAGMTKDERAAAMERDIREAQLIRSQIVAARSEGRPTAALNDSQRKLLKGANAADAEIKAEIRACMPSHWQNLLYNADLRDKSMQEYCDPFAPHQINFSQHWKDRKHKRGYVWEGGMVAGKYWQLPFIEYGFRSEKGPQKHILQRILASTARLHKGLRGGPAKDDRRRYFTKVAAIDSVYICCSAWFRDLFRVELDKNFRSYEHLYGLLLALVEDGGLPCMPHVIVWIFDDRYPGQVLRPHLIWILPEGEAVRVKKKAHTRDTVGVADGGAQLALMRRVAGAINCALKRLGADQGGMANLWDFKSPLSPHCEYRVANPSITMNLTQMSECIDMSLPPEAAEREMNFSDMAAAGLDKESSQCAWLWGLKSRNGFGRKVYLSNPDRWDERVNKRFDAEQFVDAITLEMLVNIPKSIAPRSRREDENFKRAVRFHARHVVETFLPDAIERVVIDRGAARSTIDPSDNQKTRQRKGQAFGAERRVENTLGLVTDVLRTAVKNGHETTIRAIAERAGRHRNTVAKHMDEAWATVKHELANDQRANATIRNNLEKAVAATQKQADHECTVSCWKGATCVRSPIKSNDSQASDSVSELSSSEGSPISGPGQPQNLLQSARTKFELPRSYPDHRSNALWPVNRAISSRSSIKISSS